jgi:hypothetical protein
MLIISAKSGQLGNRLLLFANFIAWAIEHNLTVLNPAFDEYAEFFVGTAGIFCVVILLHILPQQVTSLSEVNIIILLSI